MKEVERAFDKGIVIIPVRTEEVEPSEALEFFLSSEHWLDAFNPPLETHIDRLTRTVEEYLVEQGWTVAEASAEPLGTAERLSQRGRGRNSTNGCSEAERSDEGAPFREQS